MTRRYLFNFQSSQARRSIMKRMRSRIYLPVAAMILTAAFAVPAAAQKQVPF
jgi:hypothetical protein